MSEGTTEPRDTMRDEPIRVLLADDQALLRESCKKLLELTDSALEIVGVARGPAIVRSVRRFSSPRAR